MLVKTCGVATTDDIERLTGTAAQWVGLWYGVPGGQRDLSMGQLTELADAARGAKLTPVIVTLLDEPSSLTAAVEASGVDHVQLHGFTPPRRLAGLRAALLPVTLIKVLHVARGRVLDLRWAAAYEQCGTDLFLFDSVGENGRIGSTGCPLDSTATVEALGSIRLPFLLAGGLTATNYSDHREALRHPRLLGIDIDSGARDENGAFQPAHVNAIAAAWREELHHARRTM